MTEAELTQIADLWKRGLNTQQIANHMGIPEQAVYGTTLEIALKRGKALYSDALASSGKRSDSVS